MASTLASTGARPVGGMKLQPSGDPGGDPDDAG